MKEASKTQDLLTHAEQLLLTGKGIDIGCGNDPIRIDARPFDVADGDANHITNFVQPLSSFDYVFSSHCLEHMRDPEHALKEWWQLVKPGGVMLIVVPDEDLYEQGYWPSLFNPDHKFTFTLAKQSSWSPVSRNLLDLAKSLEGSEVLAMRLQDDRYKRGRLHHKVWPRAISKKVATIRYLTGTKLPFLRWMVDWFCLALRFPIDQTMDGAVAQNLLVLTKKQS
jgi:SAM-dependent methyltransferase